MMRCSIAVPAMKLLIAPGRLEHYKTSTSRKSRRIGSNSTYMQCKYNPLCSLTRLIDRLYLSPDVSVGGCSSMLNEYINVLHNANTGLLIGASALQKDGTENERAAAN